MESDVSRLGGFVLWATNRFGPEELENHNL